MPFCDHHHLFAELEVLLKNRAIVLLLISSARIWLYLPKMVLQDLIEFLECAYFLILPNTALLGYLFVELQF